MNRLNEIINGNCVEVMQELSDESVHLTVTSPPWDNLRTFKGNKLTWKMFCVVAAELYRLTCEGGVVCWHVGEQVKNFTESLTARRQLIHFVDEVGFSCHKTLIMEVSNGNNGRLKQYPSTQFCYVLCKGVPRVINLIKDVRNKTFGDYKSFTNYRKNDVRELSDRHEIPEFRVRGPIWRYHTGTSNAEEPEVRQGHPALMPEKLARDLIYSWSKAGDVVFDPFAGAGTTLKMASLQGRHYLGIEIDPEFVKLARNRVRRSLVV